jgi:AAA domain-containing protein
VAIAQERPFLGFVTTKAPVLILALEEHRRAVLRRLKRFGCKPYDPVYVRTVSTKDSVATRNAIRDFVVAHKIGLVVIDTLSRFWTVENENDNAQVQHALDPWIDFAHGLDVAVLLVHHTKKTANGNGGRDIRGGSTIFGTVDQALILSKPRKHKNAPPPPKNQRILDIVGRYGEESPDQLRLELDGAEYRVVKVVGGAEEVAKNPRQVVSEALTADWQDADTIAIKAKVGKNIARDLLQQMVRDGHADISGKGVKGNPFLFRRLAEMHPRERLTDEELFGAPLPAVDAKWEQ